MFPIPNNANALYNIGLNIMTGIYFSMNANTVIAVKPIATKVKYNFFRLFILSLGLIVYHCVDLTVFRYAADAEADRPPHRLVSRLMCFVHLWVPSRFDPTTSAPGARGE